MTKPPSYLDMYEVVRLPRPPHLREASHSPYYLAPFPKGPAYSFETSWGELAWRLAEDKP